MWFTFLKYIAVQLMIRALDEQHTRNDSLIRRFLLWDAMQLLKHRQHLGEEAALLMPCCAGNCLLCCEN